MKKIIVLGLLVMAMFTVSVVGAQEADNALEYGETGTGEITNQEFEAEFTFEGTAGDVVVLRMIATEDTLSSPEITLLDPNSDVIAVSSYGGYLTTEIFAELAEDGDYTVIAGRYDGRAGEGEGAFELTVLNAPVLEVEVMAEGSATSVVPTYYSLSSADAFVLDYKRVDGTFPPEVSVNIIGSYGLEPVAALYGINLTAGQITVQGSSDTYIVKVGTALSYYAFDEEAADYTLTVLPAAE